MGIPIINENSNLLGSCFLETTKLTWTLASHLTALFALNRMSQLLLLGCANAALLVGWNKIHYLGRGKSVARWLGAIRSKADYLGTGTFCAKIARNVVSQIILASLYLFDNFQYCKFCTLGYVSERPYAGTYPSYFGAEAGGDTLTQENINWVAVEAVDLSTISGKPF